MEPLQITIHLTEPMVLKEESARLMTLDALLAAAAYQETGDIRAGDALPLARRTHPNGQWVYHASSWRAVGHLSIDHMTIYKRTSAVALESVGLATTWERGRGPTKDYELTYHTYATPAIRFSCVGDRGPIARLLDRLYFIGSKWALRKGQIHHVTLASRSDDTSLVHNGVVTRPIPLALAENWTGLLQHVGAQPPYWHPNHKTLCLVPPMGPLIDEEALDYATAP